MSPVDTEQTPLDDFNESERLNGIFLLLTKELLVGLSKNGSESFYGSFPISAISVLWSV